MCVVLVRMYVCFVCVHVVCVALKGVYMCVMLVFSCGVPVPS